MPYAHDMTSVAMCFDMSVAWIRNISDGQLSLEDMNDINPHIPSSHFVTFFLNSQVGVSN